MVRVADCVKYGGTIDEGSRRFAVVGTKIEFFSKTPATDRDQARLSVTDCVRATIARGGCITRRPPFLLPFSEKRKIFSEKSLNGFEQL